MAATTDQQQAAAVDLAALLDAGEGAVVTLVAGGTRLAAHRAVLVAGSPVYAAMFRHDCLEASTGEVSIQDVEGPVLRQLVAYMYTGRAPQLPDMAPQVLAAADKYGISGLKDACEQQVVAQLDLENAAATAVLAVRYNCPSLTAATLAFIKARTHQVMATEGWAEAVVSHPKGVVEFTRMLAEPAAEKRRLPAKEKGRRLLEVAEEGAVGEVRALLAAGADVRASDRNKNTALHFAAEKGHLEVTQALLLAGAEVDARDSVWQQTSLHYAAANGHTAVLRLLLEASADINARNKRGVTPLHCAAQCGHAQAAAVLLDVGADRGARDNDGETALDYTREQNHQELVRLLQ